MSDRIFDLNINVWILAGPAAFILWLICRKRIPGQASSILFLMALSVGGLWHHVRWNQFGNNEIGLFATDEYQPCAIRAIVTSDPRTKMPQPASHFDNVADGIKTQLAARVVAIRDGEKWVRSSGNLLIQVEGQVDSVAAGDQIECHGKLIATKPARNPGEFDFYEFNRSRGRFGFVTVKYPQAMSVIESSDGFGPNAWIQRLRKSLDQQIWRHVGSSNAPIASAILLGNRQHLTDEQNDAFLVSGTIHILAISGLHVGILAAGLLFIGRIEWIGRRRCLILTMFVVLFYAWLVEFRPPVLRASVLVSLYCCGRLSGRDGFSINILALAAIIVLMLNPSDLFNAGAQLSFLAVATLSFSRRWLAIKISEDPLDQLILRTRPLYLRMLFRFRQRAWQAVMMSVVIWLAAMPLVALRFNLVSPIGIVINPLLMIPLAVALYLGMATLLFGWLLPPAGTLFGSGCDQALGMVEWSITNAGHVPGGHFWTCGPSVSAVIIFYLGFVILFAYKPTRVRGRTLLACFVGWIAFGWFLPNWCSDQIQKGQAEVTFVDVGHGTSVLIELPDGKVVLYDCGSFGAADKGTRQISAVLWEKGIKRIDAVVISHSDLDHFNCLPQLADRFRIDTVYVSPIMGSDPAISTQQLFLEMKKRNIPVKTLKAGDCWGQQQPGYAVNVLGPTAAGHRDSDNSNSIILAIQFPGQRILLPGDLEGEGLHRLLGQATEAYDIVMAPHHGSRNSLPKGAVPVDAHRTNST